jgi:hypothetical protein
MAPLLPHLGGGPSGCTHLLELSSAQLHLLSLSLQFSSGNQRLGRRGGSVDNRDRQMDGSIDAFPLCDLGNNCLWWVGRYTSNIFVSSDLKATRETDFQREWVNKNWRLLHSRKHIFFFFRHEESPQPHSSTERAPTLVVGGESCGTFKYEQN